MVKLHGKLTMYRIPNATNQTLKLRQHLFIAHVQTDDANSIKPDKNIDKNDDDVNVRVLECGKTNNALIRKAADRIRKQ